MENRIFWSEIGQGFSGPGGTPPPKNIMSTPREITPLQDPVCLVWDTIFRVTCVAVDIDREEKKREHRLGRHEVPRRYYWELPNLPHLTGSEIGYTFWESGLK